MERFIHNQNMLHLRKQYAETTDEAKQRQILRLLEKQEANAYMLPNAYLLPNEKLATPVAGSPFSDGTSASTSAAMRSREGSALEPQPDGMLNMRQRRV